MRVPNLSSTIAFYPREMEDRPPFGLVPVWNNITVLTKGAVASIPGYPLLLDVTVPFNRNIVKSMRVTVDGGGIQYAITDRFTLGTNEFLRLVLDTEDFLELPPVTDVKGPITIHTRTDLVGFLKGDGYNIYADPDGGGGSSNSYMPSGW